MCFTIPKHIYIVSVLILFHVVILKAQTNLVPNSSFEQYTTCPSSATLYDAKNSKPDIWYKPDKRNAGYLNGCADSLAGVPNHYTIGGKSFQYARTGVAYVGMFYRNGGITNLRNYFQVLLTDSLKPGKCYYAECYVNCPNTFEMACNNQSILLTNNPVYADTTSPSTEFLSANPQVTNYNNGVITDTSKWIRVNGVFVAQGGEQYLTIGNFRDNNNTQYIRFQPPGTGYEGAGYYVDDVSLYALDSFPLKADAGSDTTIALGDSVFIGSLTNGIPNITWYDTGGNLIDTGRPGFYVKPTTTTTYIIEQTVCGYYSRDTVVVIVNLLPLHCLKFDLTPGPSPTGLERGDVLLRWQTANEQNVSHYNIQRSYRGTNEFENVGQVAANNKAYNEYSYVDELTRNEKQETALYRIQGIDKDGMRSYSEIRRVRFGATTAKLGIYPNPAKGKVNIEYNKLQQVTITDVLGHVVLNKVLPGVNTLQIDISHFAKGIFIIKATGVNGDVETQKLIVE